MKGKNLNTDYVEFDLLNLPAGIWTPIRGTLDDISWSGGHQKLDRAPSSTALDLDISGGHSQVDLLRHKAPQVTGTR